MKGFLQNGLQYPARPPRLNYAHPFARQGNLILAAVANPNGGMTDLVTGATVNNTGTKTEINEIGPCVYSSGLNSTSFLSFPFIGPASWNFVTVQIIYKFVASGSQWLFQIPATGGGATGLQQQAGNVFWVVAGGNKSGGTPKVNDSVFIEITNNVGTSGNNNQWLFNCFNRGYLYVDNTTSGGAFSGASPITLLQLNDGLTGPVNRLAALAISVSSNTPPSSTPNPAMPAIGEIRAARDNPWSLWYGNA